VINVVTNCSFKKIFIQLIEFWATDNFTVLNNTATDLERTRLNKAQDRDIFFLGSQILEKRYSTQKKRKPSRGEIFMLSS